LIPLVRLADDWGSAHGVVHRDIKPHNLFFSGVGSERLVKIGDFGMAKAFDLAGLSGLSETGGMPLGTPAYMPRPLAFDIKSAKPEIEVWAMAATLYRMLVGVPPRDFPPGKLPWLVVTGTKPVPIRKRNPWVPKKLAQLIDYTLIDDPEIQIKTASDFKR